MQTNIFSFKNFTLLILFVIIGLGVGFAYKYFENTDELVAPSEDLKVIPVKTIEDIKNDELIGLNENNSDCSDVPDIQLRDDCLIRLATQIKDVTVCDRISDQNYKERCKTFPEFINN